MAEQSKNKKTAVIVSAILAVLILAVVLIVVLRKPAATQQGKKTIVVEVINGEDKREFTVHTDQEFLRGALEELNLIKGSESEYGLFVTEVNGVAADDTKQQWWCFTKGGEELMTGVDTTPIADGDHFEIELKTGW